MHVSFNCVQQRVVLHTVVPLIDCVVNCASTCAANVSPLARRKEYFFRSPREEGGVLIKFQVRGNRLS